MLRQAGEPLGIAVWSVWKPILKRCRFSKA
jgi:hypothetical protein